MTGLYEVTLYGDRVHRLRGYGNAINAEAAKTFIEISMTKKFAHESYTPGVNTR